MASIAENIAAIQNRLPEGTKLIAVSKTKPNEVIMEAYDAGHRVFGENKVQELVAKYEALPKDIEWHMIGHLQRNKVKFIVPFVHLIHGVDSFRLLKEINKQGKNISGVIDVLLQVHIAQEDTKFGFSKEELLEMLESDEFQAMEHVRICGLMGMATYTEDNDLIKKEFGSLAYLFGELKASNFREADYFNQLSMGMSSDYEFAVQKGSTMVRVGSSIFGSRNYN